MGDDMNKYKELGMRINSAGFKKWYKAGLFKIIDKDFAREVNDYWSIRSKLKIRPGLHLAFMNLTNRKELRLVPSNVMNFEVLPVLNDYNMTSFYGDKNIYDLIIKPTNSAVTVLRCINGKYFDSDYNNINLKEALNILSSRDDDLIIKPSLGNNGTGISKLIFKQDKIFIGEEEIDGNELLKNYGGNFIVQEMLKQHRTMAAPHPESVNTIRMVTFRWENEIKYLLAFARFGSDGDIRDNANVESSPRVGIKDTGEFFDYGIGQSGEKFTEHPTTGFKISALEPIPNYEEFKQFVKDTHKNFLHLDFISWDIAVGEDGKPVFIEANFAGSTSFYQLVSQKPIFGDLTEEVMDYVKNQLRKSKKVLMTKHVRKRNERYNNRIQKENEQNKLQIINLKKEIEFASYKNNKAATLKVEEVRRKEEKLKSDFEKERQNLIDDLNRYKNRYDDMKQSKSWRITAPLRKIISVLGK